MATTRFTTTRLSGLRAAGRVGEMHNAVITALLQRELGDRHARLFADFEPEGSDRRAWYTESSSPPRRAADLEAADGEAIRTSAVTLIGDIRALAERLASSGSQPSNLARILLAATVYPEEDLWCVGDQPLIVNWGFTREERVETAPRAITGLAPVPKPAAEPGRSDAGSLAKRSTSLFRGVSDTGLLWPAPLLWLLFVVFLGLIYRMLLPACGVDGRWPALANWSFLNACEGSAEAIRTAREGVQLQAMVRQAELELAQKKQFCPAPTRFGRAAPQVEERLPPTAPRGNVEISLLWDNHADLDLIIDCPGGEHLSQASYGLQACGGRLLADVNKAGGAVVDHPIEHAAWDRPAAGLYTVKVELYDYNDIASGADVPFTIHVRQDGDDKTFAGHVAGARKTVTATEVRF